MLVAVFSGFLLALFMPALHRVTKNLSGWLVALLPLSLFLYFATFLEPVAQGEVIREFYTWVPRFGINLSFMVDGLSLLLVLIITGVGTLIFVYAGGYLHGDPYEGRFYSFLLIFMAAMIGLVLSDNLLMLFIFWELTSISSYLLIGFKHDYAESRNAALRALFVTGAGGLAMLAGFILLGIVGGTLDISALDGEAIRSSPLYLGILLLVALGAFTKSAQFPFHFWLPGAMAAPTPVSAYLHSATMVKAGIYLLARLSPTLSGTDEWRLIITGVGVITMLLGAYLSLKQLDLKRILAYSTVSSLGMLVALLGWDTKIAIEAAMLFLLVHSLYKGALFMAAGAIDHETGTRDITSLGGLLRVMPFIALATILAFLSMSGIPPLIGFIGKELIYEATLGYEKTAGLELDLIGALFTLAAVLTNIATIVVGCLVLFKPFFGSQKVTPKHPHRAPISLWLGPVVLGVVALILGLLTELPAGELLIGPAAGAVYGSAVELELYLIPSSINPMLILSIITVAGGLGLYAILNTIMPALNALDIGQRFGPQNLFQRMIDNLPDFAKWVTKLLQSGYLRSYILTIVVSFVVLISYTLLTRVALPSITEVPDVYFFEVLLAGVILFAVALVLRSSSLLYTIAALGVIGYSIALIFILYGAPDLAMTQFSIETLSVVLFVLVLYRLPALAQLSTTPARLRDGIISAAAGGMMTLIVLIVTSRPLASKLTNFFAKASYAEAHGRNIVNVILVDFRGLDTLGEITVLAVAAIGVYSLLKLRIDDTAEDDTEAYDAMASVEEFEEMQKEQDE